MDYIPWIHSRYDFFMIILHKDEEDMTNDGNDYGDSMEG